MLYVISVLSHGLAGLGGATYCNALSLVFDSLDFGKATKVGNDIICRNLNVLWAVITIQCSLDDVNFNYNS